MNIKSRNPEGIQNGFLSSSLLFTAKRDQFLHTVTSDDVTFKQHTTMHTANSKLNIMRINVKLGQSQIFVITIGSAL